MLVRVAHAEPRLGRVVPDEPGLDPRQRGRRLHGFLVVLADDAGHRALPTWVAQQPGFTSIPDLLDRPADDIWTTARLPEQLAVRLVDAAGGSVTGVEIYPVAADPEEVNADTCAARIELGAGHVTARFDLGLALAMVAGAEVRVDGALLDRLAVPLPDDDPAGPFRRAAPPAGHVIIDPRAGRVLHVPGQPPRERPRFEPRNMTFADGLDRWYLDASAPDDFSAAAEAAGAILSSAVPEPAGSAVLTQTVYADDFRGAPVVFSAEFRAESVAGSGGLYLRFGSGKHPDREQQQAMTVAGRRDWSADEISVVVPETADTIEFGIFLTGGGKVWLRNPELRRDHDG